MKSSPCKRRSIWKHRSWEKTKKNPIEFKHGWKYEAGFLFSETDRIAASTQSGEKKKTAYAFVLQWNIPSYKPVLTCRHEAEAGYRNQCEINSNNLRKNNVFFVASTFKMLNMSAFSHAVKCC